MLELLKKVRLFSELDDAALPALQETLEPVTFAAGEDLCQEAEATIVNSREDGLGKRGSNLTNTVVFRGL